MEKLSILRTLGKGITITTNEIVYEQLPDGVLEKLKKKTPKDEISGNRTKRFHQSLMPDTGIPHLDKCIASLITLMRACDNWREFEKLFRKSFGLQDQLEISDDGATL